VGPGSGPAATATRATMYAASRPRLASKVSHPCELAPLTPVELVQVIQVDVQGARDAGVMSLSSKIARSRTPRSSLGMIRRTGRFPAAAETPAWTCAAAVVSRPRQPASVLAMHL
jgi:hypothetical protein